MKNITIFLFVFLIAVVKAQTVSDYKYIVIPAEFNDFKDNKAYGLSNLLEKSLKAKKYTVLSSTKNDWPSDALMNPCSILNTDLLNDKSMFRNKLILQFKDCNNKVVFNEKGSSMIKEFEPGFQDALKQTLVKIPVSNPTTTVNKIAETTFTEPIKKELQGSKEAILQTSNVVRYSNGTISVQKIQIDNNQFILVDGNSSVPFATFKSTTKEGVFNEKGSSMIKEFEPGFQDALKQTLVKIPVSNPTTTVNKIAETTFTEPIKKELQDSKEAILQTSNVMRYSNGTRSVQKIQIDNSQFILVDGNSSVPFATLKSTTKEGVFRVKLGSGESTIGYYENANIVIELPKANGDYIKEVFVAK